MRNSVDVSNALRNLVLDHAPNSDTFQKHYLNRNVCADLWAIHRAKNPQQAVIQQATSHGGSRDSRRVFALSDHHIADVKQDPEYARLTQLLDSRTLPYRSAQRKGITKQRKALYKKLKAKKLKQVIEEWNRRKDHQDIERQARGESFDDEPSTHVSAPPMSAVQTRMFNALMAPLVNDLEAQFQRRTKAILALMEYCYEEEPLHTKVLDAARKSAPPRPAPSPMKSVEDDMDDYKRSTLAKVMGARKIRRCFLCVVKACLLGHDHTRFDELCHECYDAGSLARHFISTHLDSLREDQKFECPLCLKKLIHKNHLRVHADAIHGINTDRA